MLKSKKKWNINASNHQDLSILDRILINRGIVSDDEKDRFLHPELQHLTPSANLAQIDQAKNRIVQAIESGEEILIYGDYDADGISSTALMMHTLIELGAQCNYYIPNRFTEGYGLNADVFPTFKEKNIGLIITVDTGIANVEEANKLKELGIDLIITDHHEVQDQLPDAYAIIHPKLSENYAFKELAGVGVAFQLAHYILEEFPVHLLAFAAIGTVADMVPLQEDNRILVYYGLKALNANDHIGLEALKQAAGIKSDKYLTERDIGFMIGPRLNAAGRITDASIAVELLLTMDISQANDIAEEIEQLNAKRQQIVKDIVKDAEKMVNPEDDVIMLYDENWHEGVLGIAASRLVKQYDRPVVMLTYKKETDELKGSARSIPAFHMFHAGMNVKHLFTTFGGHSQAAGMTFPFNNLTSIHDAFNKAARDLNPEDFKQEINHIERLHLEDATESFVQDLEKLAPFGMANEQPNFLVEAIPNTVRQIGQQNKHLKMSFNTETNTVEAIGFQFGNHYYFLSEGVPVQLVGKLEINEWNGNTSVQIITEDIAVEAFQLFDYRSKHQDKYFIPYLEQYNQQTFVGNDLNHIKRLTTDRQVDLLAFDREIEAFHKTDILYIYDLPRELDQLEEILQQTKPEVIHISYNATEDAFLQSIPDRNAFKWVYQYIVNHAPFELKTELPKMMRANGWRKDKPIFILKVFFDLAFIHVKDNVVYLNKNVEKQELSQSATYQKRIEQSNIEQLLYYSTYEELKEWFQEKTATLDNSKEEVTHEL